MTRPFPRQCFVLGPDIANSVSWEEAKATYNDMVELGIAKPPYPEFDIKIKTAMAFRSEDGRVPPGETIFRFKAHMHSIELVDCLMTFGLIARTSTDEQYDWDQLSKPLSVMGRTAKWRAAQGMISGEWDADKDAAFLNNTKQNALRWYLLLIVLLATRNAVKTVQVDKLAKMGIGRDSRHVYTTTIGVGYITEVESGSQRSVGTGRTLLPHLRRGHKRSQHYGPKNQFVKYVFIEPTFVNADEDFISQRTAYNVSMTTI